MISIIIPFYKKYTEFFNCFEKNNFEELNKIPSLELVISIDDPAESDELLDYLKRKTTSSCNFSIVLLLNDETHEWRCPSKAINQGIKQAKYEKIIVLSPETLIVPDSILKLTKHCNDTDFSLGIIKHTIEQKVDYSNITEAFQKTPSTILPYGSICFTKTQAFKVGGYNEDFITWGGDDDDFRNRLLLAGYNKKPTFAQFLHLEFSNRGINRSTDKEHQKKQPFVLEKIQEISKVTKFKVMSSLLSDETISKIFEFIPH